MSTTVVNYIQILYLCILKQLVIGVINITDSCELHSNLVSLHSETTFHQRRARPPKLWITFKSCIFAFWNNSSVLAVEDGVVVNYIQILYLCILKQQVIKFTHVTKVVNYIQILYLCILKQLAGLLTVLRASCELHSNLVSLHSETTISWYNMPTPLLWITFKSCIFAFWNNWYQSTGCKCAVVNYIQILYLCILKQQPPRQSHESHRCELHSNLVSLHSETTRPLIQNTSTSCELHSNLVSLHSETTQRLNHHQGY